MARTHSLWFPRIGARRELKFALEAYWRGESSREALQQLGAELRSRHWQDQSGPGSRAGSAVETCGPMSRATVGPSVASTR